jgi:hypothetical protein
VPSLEFLLICARLVVVFANITHSPHLLSLAYQMSTTTSPTTKEADAPTKEIVLPISASTTSTSTVPGQSVPVPMFVYLNECRREYDVLRSKGNGFSVRRAAAMMSRLCYRPARTTKESDIPQLYEIPLMFMNVKELTMMLTKLVRSISKQPTPRIKLLQIALSLEEHGLGSEQLRMV